MEFCSPQGWCYGYKVDEYKAVNYLLSNYPEWRKVYNFVVNHWAAMTVVAADLSKYCGLTVYADSIWVGRGDMGLGMVFLGADMGREVRTPEDDEKLKKLEEKLVELKLVTTPELEVLCSCSFPPHFEEPYEMDRVPSPEPRNGSRILGLTAYWRPGGGHDRKMKRKAQEKKDRAKEL